MSIPVPALLSDITPAWVDLALADGGTLDVSVADIEVEPLGASVGLLGDLARIRVTYGRGDGPATMIVKLPTTDPGGHQVGTMLRAWAREVAFYREVAPASPGVRIPTCYYSGADPVAERWAVLLEDCHHEPVDPIRGADRESARLAVGALAQFHARWWQAGRYFEWMPGFDSTGVGGLQGPWLDAIPLFLERYGRLLPDRTDDWLTRFAPTLGQWSDRAAAEPLTIVHADYRLDNLLLAGDTVTMIDWQTALRGPGAMDLSCFIVTGLTIDNRRALEDELIDQYRTALAAEGVEIDGDWLLRSYDENLLWWMGQFANNLARLYPEDQATQDSLDSMIERTYTAAADREVGRLLQ